MSQENWANVRLTITYIPRQGPGRRGTCDWRLSAKAPGGDWTMRDTVAFGSEAVDGIGWPPSRDDMLALATEVLMGVRWDEPPF